MHFCGRKRDARRQYKTTMLSSYYHINLFDGIPQWTFWRASILIYSAAKKFTTAVILRFRAHRQCSSFYCLRRFKKKKKKKLNE